MNIKQAIRQLVIRPGLAIAVIGMSAIGIGYAQDDAQGVAPDYLVAATPTFAFFSDFSTNLHDALITAGRAARNSRPSMSSRA